MTPNMFDKYHVTASGEIFNTATGKRLQPWIGKNGYEMVTLCHDGVPKKFYVHWLVAMIYVPNPYPDINVMIDHIDGNKLNNQSSNLEWVTAAENISRAVELGLVKTGENCSWSEFTNDQVKKICEYLEEGMPNRDILLAMNFPADPKHQSLIGRIRTGKQWKQIASDYQFERKSTVRKRPDDYIREICKCLKSGLTPRQMSIKFGIVTRDEWSSFRKLVRNIRTKTCYRDISDQYF